MRNNTLLNNLQSALLISFCYHSSHAQQNKYMCLSFNIFFISSDANRYSEFIGVLLSYNWPSFLWVILELYSSVIALLEAQCKLQEGQGGKRR